MRIRRTELRLSADLTDNVSSVHHDGPSARESNELMFYPLPTFPRHNSPVNLSAGLRTGRPSDVTPHLLQDACRLVLFNVVPHHTFAIGQFKPPSGEEAARESGELDFVERAMVTSVNNVRGLGAMVSGFWFKDRLRYSVGVFNGPTGICDSDRP